MVDRVDIESKDIKEIHDEFAHMRHGVLIRRSLEWEEYFRWEVEDLTAAVYYNAAHKPIGYLYYWIENEIFHIKEIVYLNQEARHGLWNYISAHFSMINEVKGDNYTNEPMAFLLEDSEITEKIEPYFMARIVDLEKFLEKYPFVNTSVGNRLTFNVTDPMLEWNNGIFSVTWDEEGNNIVSKEEISEPISLSIQTLVTMLMGYRRPKYLKRVERIDAMNSSIKLLEKVIPLEQAYFSDYF